LRAGVRYESGTDIVAALTKVRFALEADIHRRDNLVGAHGLRRGLEIMHVGDRYGSFASRVAKYPTVFA